MSALSEYLGNTPADKVSSEFVSMIASLETVAKVNPTVARAIVNELDNQRSHLKLIASENYCSLATQQAMGNWMTDKYAEGISGGRFYQGCQNVDAVESEAAAQACRLFGAPYAYVQPHSGADANMVAYWAILQSRVCVPSLEELGVKVPDALTDEQWEVVRHKLGDQRILGLSLAAGGHLTHGYRQNVSGKMFHAFNYGVSEKDHRLDYDAIEKMAEEIKPLIIVGGYSAYPRKVDFKRMRAIADKVGAVLMVDMSHFAGLVAGKVFTGDYSPFPHAHVVTTTTHKTLRGPRGGVIFANDPELAKSIDKGCPLVLGGPLPHVMAAKAVAFTEANTPAFAEYARKVVENAAAFAEACVKEGMTLITGGTDNHLFLVDAVSSFDLSGRQAADALEECGITINKNGIPFDKLSPMVTSGLRIGTPAITSLGMGKAEMAEIASIIATVLRGTKRGTIPAGKKNAGQPSNVEYVLDPETKKSASARVKALLSKFVLYPQIDLEFLRKHFC